MKNYSDMPVSQSDNFITNTAQINCPVCHKECKPVGFTNSYKLKYEQHNCKPNYLWNESTRCFYLVDNSYLVI